MLSMNAEHEAFFKELFRVPANEDLPEEILLPYWRLKRICDNRGVTIDPIALALIAHGSCLPLHTDKKNFLDVIRENTGLPRDTDIEVFWRGHWKPGKYVSHTTKTVIVVIGDGTGEEREMFPDKVRLPQTVEV